jgi:site-specific DNA-methyltransferase (adenine-specific)
LPGAYFSHCEKAGIVAGAKPVDLMRSIIRDYSKPGDIICDPYAGGGSTLLAAVLEGRRAIGAEANPETFAKAAKRLARGYTPTMFPE